MLATAFLLETQINDIQSSSDIVLETLRDSCDTASCDVSLSVSNTIAPIENFSNTSSRNSTDEPFGTQRVCP
jgi:hypothetical protein